MQPTHSLDTAADTAGPPRAWPATIACLCLAAAACADAPRFGPGVPCDPERACRLPLVCMAGECAVPAPAQSDAGADVGSVTAGMDGPEDAGVEAAPPAPACTPGRAAFCGRSPEGIVCAFADEGGNWAAPALVAPAFSDAAGWQRAPSYQGTIQFPDVDGDGVVDVCGRSPEGIVCALGRRAGGFGEASLWSAGLGDARGWGESPDRWASIRFPDLDGNGRADVCGHAPTGQWCALSSGRAFGPLELWGPPLAQTGATWAQPEVWGTLQYPDLDRDRKQDLCVRGPSGIHCALSSGLEFGALRLWSAGLKDGWQGNDPSVWPTIGLVDVSGDGLPDLCGRGFFQLACLLNQSGSAALDPADRFVGEARAPEFGDLLGFGGGISYYGSIQYPDLDGDGRRDICGKAPDGLWCLRSPGFAGNLQATRWTDEVSDARGWQSPVHALSLTFADLDGDGKDDLCGRRADGLHCALSNGKDAFVPGPSLAAFRDEDGFQSASSAATTWFGRFVTGDCHRLPPAPPRRPLALAIAAGQVQP